MPQRTATTSIDEREALLHRYLPLVRRVARRHLSKAPAAALDDLVSGGTVGLLGALERYDPARETLFSTYARFRIRGAILDQLRALDWVPRSLREKAAAVERTANVLAARLGRPATDEEMAAALSLSLDAYRALQGEITPLRLVSLDDAGMGDDEPCQLDPPDPPLAALLRRERLDQIASAIRGLSQRDQLLLSLYYRDELTMREVGAVLGLTESRVSQLHAQALARLRVRLEDPLREVVRTG
jgi:RNA polymerase sigma factor FliA